MTDHIAKLKQAAQQLSVLIDAQPGFREVLDHRLMSKHSRLPEGSCTDDLYVNLEAPATLGQTPALLSHSVTKLIDFSFTSRQFPTYTQGSTRVYNRPYTVADEDVVPVIDIVQVEEFVHDICHHLQQHVETALEHFWQSPLSYLQDQSPKDWFYTFLRNVLVTESKLRLADNTLSAQGHAAIAQLQAFPSARQRLDSQEPSPRVVYEIAFKRPPFPNIPLQGLLAIVDNSAAESGDTSPKVVLYVPGSGLEEFESLHTLSQELLARLGDPYQRTALLSYVAVKDRAAALDLTELSYHEIKGDVFSHFVDGLIQQQALNLREVWKTIRAEQVEYDLDALSDRLEKALDASFYLDPAGILKARYTRLFENQLPEWLKQAPEARKQAWRMAVQQLYQAQLAAQTRDTQGFFASGSKNSLLAYARARLRQQIQKDHNADIDPDSVIIATTEAFNTSPGFYPFSTSGYTAGNSVRRTGPTFTYKTTRRTLSDLALDNVGKLDITFALTAQIEDDKRKRHPFLTSAYLKALVRTLDIGATYKKTIEDALLYEPALNFKSAQAQWRQERYVALNDAQLNLDLLEAQLTDKTENTLSPEEVSWVEALRNYPIEKDRPLVAGHRIKVNELILKGYPLPGVWVITATPSTRLLCYTPNAPDKVWFRRVDSFNELGRVLSSDALRSYVLNRVTPAKQPYIKPLLIDDLLAAKINLQSISKHFQKTAYAIEAQFAVRNADEQSTSTYETNVQTAKDLALTVIDIISFVLPTKIMLPLVLMRFIYSVADGMDALERDEKLEAMLHFLDSLAHLTDGASDFAGSMVFGRSLRNRAIPRSSGLNPEAASTLPPDNMTLRTGGHFGSGVYEHIDPSNKQVSHYLKDSAGKLHHGQYDNLNESWYALDKRQPDALYRTRALEIAYGRWDSAPTTGSAKQPLAVHQLLNKYEVIALDVDGTRPTREGIYTVTRTVDIPDSKGVYPHTTHHFILQDGRLFEVKKGWLGRHWYLHLNSGDHRSTYKVRRHTSSDVWEVKTRQADKTKLWQPLKLQTPEVLPDTPVVRYSEYAASPEFTDTLDRLTSHNNIDFTNYCYSVDSLESARSHAHQLQLKMYKDAKAFFKDLPAKQRIPSPGFAPDTGVPEILTTLNKKYTGVIIGETHSAVSSKKVIIDHFDLFKKNDVKTLYLEHLQADLHQLHLDAFSKTGHVSPRLNTFLRNLDNGYSIDPSSPYSFSNLVYNAQKHGLRIIAIDCVASYYTKGIAGPIDIARPTLFSYGASQIIRNHQAQTGSHKWIALVGNTHANTHQGVPGLAELEGAISLRVADVKPGSQRGISVDRGDVGKTDFIGSNVAFMKNDFLLEVEIPGKHPKTPPLTESQLEQTLPETGQFLFDKDHQHWPDLIHRSSSREILRSPLQTDAEGKLYIERPNWEHIHQKRYSQLDNLINDLKAHGMKMVRNNHH